MNKVLSLTGGPKRIAYGLAVLRVIVGLVFVMHGIQKLFIFGVEGVEGGFQQAGIPLAQIAAPAVSLVEFLGGILLVLGLLTPIAAVVLGLVMLGALFLVHLEAGFFLPQGIEFVLTLLAGAATIALAGPGALAVDNVLARRAEA